VRARGRHALPQPGAHHQTQARHPHRRDRVDPGAGQSVGEGRSEPSRRDFEASHPRRRHRKPSTYPSAGCGSCAWVPSTCRPLR
jgi:hypothetical protein